MPFIERIFHKSVCIFENMLWEQGDYNQKLAFLCLSLLMNTGKGNSVQKIIYVGGSKWWGWLACLCDVSFSWQVSHRISWVRLELFLFCTTALITYILNVGFSKHQFLYLVKVKVIIWCVLMLLLLLYRMSLSFHRCSSLWKLYKHICIADFYKCCSCFCSCKIVCFGETLWYW